jgi:peptidoglycan/LPS O-acetylase OafA/YrhL
MFFALSAFLLTSHLCDRLADPAGRSREVGRYAVNRVFRIFPLYVLVLAVHWAWGDFDVMGALRHVVLIEGRDELWAIPVEFKYYLVIPLVAWLIVTRGARVAATLLVLALLGSLALSYASPGVVFSNDLDLAYRLPPFLAGSLAVLLLPVVGTRLTSSAAFAAVVIAVGGLAVYSYRAVVLDTGLVQFSPLVAALLAVVSAAALLGGYHERALLARVLAARPLVFLGKISFGVYLWHLFAVRLAMEHAAVAGWVRAWLVIAASLAVATLTYVLVERRGILFGRRLGERLF